MLRYVGYTNGRHRTRYLYFAGAKQYLSCHKGDAEALLRYCGTDPA